MISCFPAESMLHLVQWLFALCNHRRGDEGGSHAWAVGDVDHHHDADGFAGGGSGEATAMDTEAGHENDEDILNVEEFEWVEADVEVADEDEDNNTVETVDDDNSEVPLSADVHLPPNGPNNRKPKGTATWCILFGKLCP